MQTIEKIERRESKDSPALHKCRLCCREYTAASALKWHVKDKHPEQFANYGLPAGHPAHVTNICRKIERKRKQADEEKKDKQDKQSEPDKQIKAVKQSKPDKQIKADKQSKSDKQSKPIKTKQSEQPQSTDKITKQLNKITEEIQKIRASLVQ